MARTTAYDRRSTSPAHPARHHRSVLATAAALLLLLTGAVGAAADPIATPSAGTGAIATTTTITCTNQVYDNVAYNPCSARTATVGGTVVGSPAVVYPADVTNAGTVLVTAAYHDPNGSYADSSGDGSFTIAKAWSLVHITCDFVVDYTGKPLEPCDASVVTLLDNFVPTSMTYSNNTGPGEATFTASYDGNANVKASASGVTFLIGKPTTTTVTCTAATYTGSPITDTCTGKTTGDGGFTATPTLTFSNNTNAGTATVKATYAGDGSGGHLASEKTTTFAIAKAEISLTVTCRPVVFTGSPLEPCLSGLGGVGTLTGATSTVYTANVGVGPASVTLSYPGDANHLPKSVTGTFAITPAPVVVTVTCPPSVEFTGAALTPSCTATVTDGYLLNEPVLPITFSNNVYAGTGTATATYTPDKNHQTGTGSTTFQIKGYTFSGYLSPVAMGTATAPAWNVVKAGSTVPLTFEAFLPNGSEITTTNSLGATFTVTQVACPPATTTVTTAIAATTSGKTALRYDTATGRFIQNWKTPSSAGCYRATTQTADHSQLSALFIVR